MALPTSKQKPIHDIDKISMILYGQPKIGKSTFASRFENAFFIATEPGLNHLETYNLRANSWRDIENIVYDLETEGNTFSPIVIDTVDNMWEFCISEICNRNNVSNISEMPFGKGYKQAEAEFNGIIKRLVQLETGMIFISHQSYETNIQTDGSEIKKFMPSIDQRARKIVMPLVDVIAFASIEYTLNDAGERQERRVLHTQPSPLWEAGDRTGKLPASMPLSQPFYKQKLEGEK